MYWDHHTLTPATRGVVSAWEHAPKAGCRPKKKMMNEHLDFDNAFSCETKPSAACGSKAVSLSPCLEAADARSGSPSSVRVGIPGHGDAVNTAALQGGLLEPPNGVV